jgi:hypothetical protein
MSSRSFPSCDFIGRSHLRLPHGLTSTAANILSRPPEAALVLQSADGVVPSEHTSCPGYMSQGLSALRWTSRRLRRPDPHLTESAGASPFRFGRDSRTPAVKCRAFVTSLRPSLHQGHTFPEHRRPTASFRVPDITPRPVPDQPAVQQRLIRLIFELSASHGQIHRPSLSSR